MTAETWNRVLNIILVACALVTTGLAARHFLSTGDKAVGSQPEYIATWKSLLPDSVRIGSAEAPVKIILFSDYECPYCARFHAIAKSVMERRRREVALYVQDFPLPGHRFAVPAARSANCAREQDRFEAMHDLLLTRQDEFGRTSWAEFAQAAQVRDMHRFGACMGKQAPPPRMVAGEKLAKKFGFRGTPTVIINGWNVNLSSEADLDRLITKAKRREPLS